MPDSCSVLFLFPWIAFAYVVVSDCYYSRFFPFSSVSCLGICLTMMLPFLIGYSIMSFESFVVIVVHTMIFLFPWEFASHIMFAC
ncbi:hypothetical protein MtrunA17_Chr7g0247201 [Medicago truncatula]|uniref:Transmembrane protein n=1 Tax=Medicago truncatula TaxID=3880 RepID=A0A396H0L6_MEDTR|nr:hypothetical protein MtrunA17_Chr7g0247201 [Medicago truncatula]